MSPSTTPVTALSGNGKLVYGCDYNPEQWDREVWQEDVLLMRQAGVNLVAVNIFGWAELEGSPGTYSFERLDEILGLLHANGIAVNLGTGTSSTPAWLTTLHPEILPQSASGTRAWPGGRQAWCPSSPLYREHALRLVQEVARRYGGHPAVRLWHVSNELGCHNALCYCDVSAAAFRGWLIDRYGSLDALNKAWGTTFWSQRYSDWQQLLPPRVTVSTNNPMQVLDFHRFSSDELLGYYQSEAEVLRQHSSIPVTTNFMVAAHVRNQDYWSWAPHMDVIANDHYLDHRLDSPTMELAFAADTTRGLANGQPWLLMEHSTSAVNWQPRNIAKGPGEMLRNSLAHLARGADGLCFFQWRASVQGSEKFHSAMLPHSGTDSRIWREVVELGGILDKLAEVGGTTVQAEAALVFSWEAWWAYDQESHPSSDVRYLDQVHAIYKALWEAGITVDVVAPGADLSGYKLAVVPGLYLVREREAGVLAEYVRKGGHAVVTYFSGIVDENERVLAGGYPGAFRSLLGIRTEEFFPLAPGQALALDNGSAAALWTEALRLEGAEAKVCFVEGHLTGTAAVTRNRHGSGHAWYIGTALNPAALRDVVTEAAGGAGITGLASPEGLEAVVRAGTDNSYVFLINHSEEEHKYAVQGHELIVGEDVSSVVAVPAGAVRVVRTSRPLPQTTGRTTGPKDVESD
ncbi:beta-galactosidase [Pseudarthrobacter cellobiosi]|uniref:beta-galactosidase n=1 Tax=Pseudarthrobacter cellobiosi TaxID=2953654 RepID=UPI00208F1BC8|nr:MULTISPECIES: beta-galactosidase [unclassified Pseudarthrobacter]MCO4255324.1 beta-galactosidase [Pseudarthrobacter sp. HLT1-5]MCO4276735.1 beta-galactosidase [Pseudarthrobacter sp. HLT3-5]